ncbi:cobyrinate a,c-diamide synthase [Kamptonema animale CS-326]|jgi:cobyrinic acid a,c-diamide synthase|uniref:cobyrinate a,c-diamide synthase n=1 Tax=Kamptonema animale TaxID=92934 RepID=UPI00232CE818|nr:cobyrinate a,c-diamide synthase [Kamptonema animale]MDB9512664.1 cobyrinate a,c-diamide synthase [Kamptonema animale CS-326]
MALVIAGERSGTGKTTIAIAILAFLVRRSLKVQSFKVGPDYIDPMFHSSITGRPCRNLDPVITSESYVRQCFTRHSQDAEFALVEGVMGLFDGVPRRKKEEGRRKKEEQEREDLISIGSTAHVARLLDLPVLLVIDCSSLSSSVAAIAHGYRSFDPKLKFAGVVLNRVGSDRHLELLKDALEPLNLPVLGVLRRQDNITIPDRHLGLVPTAELSNFNSLIEKMADLAAVCFDWEQLLPLLAARINLEGKQLEQSLDNDNLPTSNLTALPQFVKGEKQKKLVRIAVARDRAFSFYYQDNLDLLQELGAELVFWSPLADSQLPDNIQGLYFGGGFPEVFAQELSNNFKIRESIKAVIVAGMPTYAECGGLMYLCNSIVDFDGNSWPMAGILPTSAVMGKRLTLGYHEAVTLQESPLLSKVMKVCGHEFHRSSLTIEPSTPLYQMWRYGKFGESAAVAEGWQIYNVHASYLHLHWGGNIDIPKRFLSHCANFNIV